MLIGLLSAIARVGCKDNQNFADYPHVRKNLQRPTKIEKILIPTYLQQSHFVYLESKPHIGLTKHVLQHILQFFINLIATPKDFLLILPVDSLCAAAEAASRIQICDMVE